MSGRFRLPWHRKSSNVSTNVTESSPVEHVESATPTAKDYALEATSEAIRVLQSAADVVGGVPGAQQVLQLALALVETCQAVSEIEGKIAELKNHVERIMLAVVRGITRNDKGTIPKDLVEDIKKLEIDFRTIKQDLDKIAAQNRLLIAFFKVANKAKIDRCTALLKQSLVYWEVSRDVSQSVLLNTISQGIAKTANEISDMNRSMHILNRHIRKTDHTLFHGIPPPPTILYGRDTFVEDIVNLLVNTTPGSKPPRICIHAPGGIGKTSAALAVMGHSKVLDKFGKEGRYWVPCICATSPNLFLQLLYDNFRISLDTGDPLADITHEISASPSPRLVLLDNFETPWNSVEGGREDVENILNQLSALSQISIIMTMRANTPPTEQIAWIDRPLDIVDPETSYAIYCTIHPAAKEMPRLKELLVELGHMPFAITVMAQLGKTSKSMPADLLKSWHEAGLAMLQSDDEREDNISRSIGLSMSSKIMLNNVAARALLATLALLPAGTTHNRLHWWIPQFGMKWRIAISALNQAALIIDTEQPKSGDDNPDVSISIHPVVRSYMRQCDRIPSAVRETVLKTCCEFISKHQSSPGQPHFKAQLRILSAEQVNLQSILLEAVKGSNLTEKQDVLKALISFGWYQHWTKPRADVIEQALILARELGHNEYIAESLFCLGNTLFRLHKCNEACDKFVEAREYFKKLSNAQRVCECSFKLSTTYQFIREYTLSEEALDYISEEDLGEGGYLRARKEMARGEYLYCQRRMTEALNHLKAAQEALETPGDSRPVDLARCLQYVGRVLGAKSEFKDSLEAIDRSVKISEDLGLENDLMESLIVKGSILLAAQAPVDKVLPTLERSLEKTKLLGNPLGIAQALELLGELYAREQKLTSAIKFYQAAEDKYKTMPRRGRNVIRCRENQQKLASSEIDPKHEIKVDKLSRRILLS